MYREGDTDSPNMLPTAHLVTMIHGQAFFIITWHPQRYGSSYPLAWPPTWLGMWVSALGTLARKYPADYNTDNDMFDHMAKYWIIQWYFYIWQLYIYICTFCIQYFDAQGKKKYLFLLWNYKWQNRYRNLYIAFVIHIIYCTSVHYKELRWH